MGLRNQQPAFVYFLRPVGAPGPTKIGCTIHPGQRLQQALIWSPVPLDMMGMVVGTMHMEQRLHARFRHLHLHSEWFREDAELDAVMALVLAGEFDFSTLPPPWRPLARRRTLDECNEEEARLRLIAAQPEADHRYRSQDWLP